MQRSMSLFAMICGVALIAIGAYLRAGNDEPRRNTLSLDKLECSEIVVSRPGSSRKITLSVQEGHAGIWLENRKTGRTIAIYDTGEGECKQTAIGFYNDATHVTSDGFESCIFVDNNGRGVLQLKDSTGIRQIDGDDLPRPARKAP